MKARLCLCLSRCGQLLRGASAWMLLVSAGCQQSNPPTVTPPVELEDESSLAPTSAPSEQPEAYVIGYSYLDGNLGWVRDTMALGSDSGQVGYSWYGGNQQTADVPEAEQAALQALLEAIPFETLDASLAPHPGEDGYRLEYLLLQPDGSYQGESAELGMTADIPESVQTALDALQALLTSTFTVPPEPSFQYHYSHMLGYMPVIASEIKVDAQTHVVQWRNEYDSGETLASPEELLQLSALLEATPFYALESSYGEPCCDAPSWGIGVTEGTRTASVQVNPGPVPGQLVTLIAFSETLIQTYAETP